MVLQGKAKSDYMRAYMARRRAALKAGTAKSTPATEAERDATIANLQADLETLRLQLENTSRKLSNALHGILFSANDEPEYVVAIILDRWQQAPKKIETVIAALTANRSPPKAAGEADQVAQLRKQLAERDATIARLQAAGNKTEPAASELARLQEENEAIRHCLDNPSELPKKLPAPGSLVLKIRKLQIALGEARLEIERLKKNQSRPVMVMPETEAVKKLQQQLQQRTIALNNARAWKKETGIPVKGGMSFATYSKLMNVVHPDKEMPTREQLTSACRALNAWSDSFKPKVGKKR